MKAAKIMVSLMMLGALAGCEQRPAATPAADLDSMRAANGVDRTEEIAGDKTAMADLIRRSHAKGTFDDALALAMQDSALAVEIFQTVRDDARFSMPRTALKAAPAVAGSSAATKRSTTARTTSGARTTTSGRRDVLDKTEETIKKANERLDQAARVRQQAEEAKRKVEGIFKP